MPTIGFNNKTNTWTSRYSYAASNFTRINSKFFSSPSNPALAGQGESPLYLHDSGSQYNTFYGSSYGSEFTVSFNDHYSTNKIFKNLSIEGSKNLAQNVGVLFKTNNHTDNRNTDSLDTEQSVGFGFTKEINGVTYGKIQRDGRLVGGKTVVNLGKIEFRRPSPAQTVAQDSLGAPHPAFYSVFLDPESNISPQIYHTPQHPMKLVLMIVPPVGGPAFFDHSSLNSPIPENIFYQNTYDSLEISDFALIPFEGAPAGYEVFNYRDNRLNFQSASSALLSKINTLQAGSPGADVYIMGVAHRDVSGDYVRGLTADARFMIPPSKGYFEINALNLQYDKIQLAHDK